VRHAWGVLTAWEPPLHFAMAWHPGQSPDRATALSVRFLAVEGGCEVALEHSGWSACGDDAAAARNSYDEGWVYVIGRYARAAQGT